MRRRSLLASIGLCLPGLAGCAATDSGAPATPTGTPRDEAEGSPGSGFASTVRAIVDDPIHFTPDGRRWLLEYPTDVTQGDPFETEQARIATAFAEHRPADVSLAATATHDCMTVDWRVSASLAQNHVECAVDDEEYRSRIQETIDRTNTC